jgi:hypothetical protein
MRNISKPFVTKDDPDRHIRCQDAPQFAFRDLIEAAVAAGWTEQEALDAVGYLAEGHMRERVARADAAALAALLKTMR